MTHEIAIHGAPGWLPDAASPPEPSLRGVAIASLLTIALGFGGLFAWAATARLDSAVTATGTVVAAGKRKVVTLLESGTLRELLVREGDHVSADQVLLRLDDVQARAAADQASAQYWGAAARASRLQAELLDQRELSFPAGLTAAASDPAIAAQVEAERHLFAARWEAFDGAARIARRRIAQQEAATAALQVQIGANATRAELLQQELTGVEYLLARGYATRTRALEMRRVQAELRGQLGELAGRLAEMRQMIAQTELEIVAAADARRAEITRDRRETETVLADSAQRLRGAQDMLRKREVLSPEAGVVTDLKYYTPGSSIVAGQPVLDLVPAGDRLVIEGAVSPIDIENVKVGQPVNVRLTAYKARQVPVLTGRLTYVAADRMLNPSNEPVFLVRAELDPGALSGLPGVALSPGMTAELLIIGGERYALDFLLSPIRDSLRHGLREK